MLFARHSCKLRESGRHLNVQRRPVSSFSQRYREQQLPNLAPLREALNWRIAAHLKQSQYRSFSHLYRRQKQSTAGLQCLSRMPIDSPLHVHLDVRNLLNSAHLRSYSASYRKHHVELLRQISTALIPSLFRPEQSTQSRHRRSSISEILAARSFSHSFRSRQFAYLRAYLPNSKWPPSGNRRISSVPLSSQITENDAASTKKRKYRIITGVVAGVSALLLYQFSSKDDPATYRLNEVTYVPFTLDSVRQVSPSAAIFTLKSKSEESLDEIQPVASISIKEPNANIQRPYTILKGDKETIQILVKRYDSGDLSRYIHSRQSGMELFARKAPSAYVLPAELPSHYTLIVGGTGIAVAHQLIQNLIKVPDDCRPSISLFYSSLDQSEVYLQQEFDALRETYGKKMEMTYYVDSNGTFINAKDLKRSMREASTTTLVCGSDGFVAYVAGAKPEIGQGQIGGLLKSIGVDHEVYKL